MAQWLNVRTALLERLPLLIGWDAVVVAGGVAYDANKSLICTVGHATDGVTSTAGSFTRTASGDGFSTAEQGSVACQLSSFDGNTSVDDNLLDLFTLLEPLEAWLKANRTLGVLSADATSDLVVDVSSSQPMPGATATLTFTVNYTTVDY